MLAVPLVTGAATGLLAGGHAASLAPLAAAVLALFWLRTPVESWLGVSAMKARTAAEFQLVRRVAARLAAVAAASAVWLFWGGRNLQLLWIGAAAAFAFVAQAVVKQRGRENREASQIVGAAGLTAVAPAAYYVVTGGFHGRAASHSGRACRDVRRQTRARPRIRDRPNAAAGSAGLRSLPMVRSAVVRADRVARLRVVRVGRANPGGPLSGEAGAGLRMRVWSHAGWRASDVVSISRSKPTVFQAVSFQQLSPCSLVLVG